MHALAALFDLAGRLRAAQQRNTVRTARCAASTSRICGSMCLYFAEREPAACTLTTNPLSLNPTRAFSMVLSSNCVTGWRLDDWLHAACRLFKVSG